MPKVDFQISKLQQRQFPVDYENLNYLKIIGLNEIVYENLNYLKIIGLNQDKVGTWGTDRF